MTDISRIARLGVNQQQLQRWANMDEKLGDLKKRSTERSSRLIRQWGVPNTPAGRQDQLRLLVRLYDRPGNNLNKDAALAAINRAGGLTENEYKVGILLLDKARKNNQLNETECFQAALHPNKGVPFGEHKFDLLSMLIERSDNDLNLNGTDAFRTITFARGMQEPEEKIAADVIAFSGRANGFRDNDMLALVMASNTDEHLKSDVSRLVLRFGNEDSSFDELEGAKDVLLNPNLPNASFNWNNPQAVRRASQAVQYYLDPKCPSPISPNDTFEKILEKGLWSPKP